ncbi:MAG: hypothetical protein IPM31_14985 [Anaerolineae bacterium]|nr:hypothetical protein [Anaerolineae bacterium]MBL8106956.1 hypothetical protein [Anaerolineales bacterium]MCC7188057.1 hypothetical protein [Anaerolineales bacterium]
MLGDKVSDLTIDELRSIIRETVRQTLADILSDPDEGLESQDGIEASLRQSLKAVREGASTYDAKEVADKLGLNW